MGIIDSARKGKKERFQFLKTKKRERLGLVRLKSSVTIRVEIQYICVRFVHCEWDSFTGHLEGKVI